jgi:voltage-gated potassium channel
MTPLRHFLLALLALTLLTTVGMIGYMSIEGWSPREALYMTVISLSTVGFGEVRSLSSAGQWFTIAYLILGFGLAGFAVAGITAFVVQGELRNMLKGRLLDHKILQLENHYVLCGCGAVGREIASAFTRAGRSVVVIDIDIDLGQRMTSQ